MYVYECQKCSHTYQKLEGWDAKTSQRCPECKGKAIRIPQAPAIVFKGSGWYSTDNRRSSWESRSDQDSPGGGDGGDHGGSGSEGSDGGDGVDANGSDIVAPSKAASAKMSTAKASEAKTGTTS